MDELVERVRLALAAEYPGAPNGRVRDVPDRRAIRWYTTTGLVDRPAGMRGRTALYGPRHLLQLVAVKRRQAQGHSLAAIQAELAGAADADLAIAARVPEELLVVDDAPEAADGPARPRFWAAAPGAAVAAPERPTATVEQPTKVTPEGNIVVPPGKPDAAGRKATLVGGVALGGGAILVLPVRPSPADLDDLSAAARPLLDLLAARGLLNTDDRSPS